jgi:predicted transcriptional regulator
MGRKRTRTEDDVRRYQREYKRAMRNAQSTGLKYSKGLDVEAERQAHKAELWRLIAKHGGLTAMILSRLTGRNYQNVYSDLMKMEGLRREKEPIGRQIRWYATDVSAAWKEVL